MYLHELALGVVFSERFQRGNGEQQITDTSSPVRQQCGKSSVWVRGVQVKWLWYFTIK